MTDAIPGGTPGTDRPSREIASPEHASHPEASAPGTCPACGVGGAGDPLEIPEMMFGTGETFSYTRCRACGSLRIDDVPADLDRHYPPLYRSRSVGPPDAGTPPSTFSRLRGGAELFGAAQLVRRVLGRLAPLPRSYDAVVPLVRQAGLRSFDDPILDVGCGTNPGRLHLLREAGFRNLTGIDPFLDADTVIGGVPVLRREIDDVDGPFALITFHHSLEHMPHPRATLRAVRARLRDGGACLVRTPILPNALWDRYGVHWAELDAPRHLVVFSHDGLVSAAADAGLRLEAVLPDEGSFELIASEQYSRGISLYAPNSHVVDPTGSPFSPEDLKGFTREAKRLNKEGGYGRAGFWFRAA